MSWSCSSLYECHCHHLLALRLLSTHIWWNQIFLCGSCSQAISYTQHFHEKNRLMALGAIPAMWILWFAARFVAHSSLDWRSNGWRLSTRLIKSWKAHFLVVLPFFTLRERPFFTVSAPSLHVSFMISCLRSDLHGRPFVFASSQEIIGSGRWMSNRLKSALDSFAHPEWAPIPQNRKWAGLWHI